MKKILSILLTVALLAMLIAGCAGGSGDAGSTEEPAAEETEAAEETTEAADADIYADLPEVVMKVGTIENSNNLGAAAVNRFGEIMAERTGGKFTVEAYHDSQLGDAMDQIEQVRSGSLQAYRGSVSWLGAYIGDIAVIEFPYLCMTPDEIEQICMGPTMSAIDEQLAAEYGIRWATASWSRLSRQMLTVDPVESVADLNGVKLRVPDSKTYIDSFKAMGASPTVVALNETYLALKQGVVSGVENHVETLYNMNFYEVAKHLTITNHAQDVTGFLVNEEWWQSLPQEYRDLIIEVDAEVNDWFVGEREGLQQDYIDKMVEAGVTVHEVDITEFMDAVFPDVAYEIEAEGFWSEGLVDKILAELKEIRGE